MLSSDASLVTRRSGEGRGASRGKLGELTLTISAARALLTSPALTGPMRLSPYGQDWARSVRHYFVCRYSLNVRRRSRHSLAPPYPENNQIGLAFPGDLENLLIRASEANRRVRPAPRLSLPWNNFVQPEHRA